jgi:hypothetical protein
MAVSTKKKDIKYLNKDYVSFHDDIINFAKAHFGEHCKDFSEPSVAGMFVGIGAYVGDVLSFYMDRQLNEVFAPRELKNINKKVKQFGYKPVPPTPSTVSCNFQIEVPAIASIPDSKYLIKVKKGTIVSSDSGIQFELLEDVDFSKYSVFNIVVASVDSNGNPSTFFVEMDGTCVSGEIKSQDVVVGTYKAFPKIQLSDEDITEVISVFDSANSEYFQVENLSQDTVFESFKNLSSDSALVENVLALRPVPNRYVDNYNIDTRLTTLTFGSGRYGSDDNDIVPDPSKYAIPMYGKTTISNFSIDPNKFLRTRTFGNAPFGTTLSVKYRVGGGLTHNVSAGSINTIDKLLTEFSTNSASSSAVKSSVVGSVVVSNVTPATGGEERQTLQEIENNLGAFYASQNRVVTREDFISRIYSMPAKFGRVYKVMVVPSRIPSVTELRILSRNSTGQLINSPITLKENVKKFLSVNSMLNDRIEIFDSRIADLTLNFSIVTQSGFNKEEVLSATLKSLYSYFNISNFQIGQSILVSDVRDVIFNVDGVISIYDIEFSSRSGNYDGRVYASESNSVIEEKGIILCPQDTIFHIRYPEFDILGKTS